MADSPDQDPQHEPAQPALPQVRPRTSWPKFPPRPEPLLATIRRLAQEGRIAYADHAEERLAERGLDVFDVREVLLGGHIDGPVEAGKLEGEWKVKVVDNLEGSSRKVGVATIVVREQRLIIKTVEWEDK